MRGRLNYNRLPGTVEEARRVIAYNEMILRTSQSAQRRHRAAQMLANLRPELARLEAQAARRQPSPSSTPCTRIVKGQEFKIVWDGAVK